MHKLAVLILAAMLAPTVIAAQKDDVEVEVLKASEMLIEAIAKCDVETSGRLMTKDELVITPRGTVTTRAERETSERPCRPVKRATVSERRVRVYGGDVGIETGRIVIYTPEGKPRPAARFTAVFVKEDGQWKEASYQGTPILEAK